MAHIECDICGEPYNTRDDDHRCCHLNVVKLPDNASHYYRCSDCGRKIGPKDEG